MSLLKLLGSLEKLSESIFLLDKRFASLNALASEEKLQVLVRRARAVRERFRQVQRHADNAVRDLLQLHAWSTDLTFGKAFEAVRAMENRRRLPQPLSEKVVEKILGVRHWIELIDDFPDTVNVLPGGVQQGSAKKIGRWWMFAVTRLCEVAVQKDIDRAVVVRLATLRDAGVMDDRDLYEYCGQILGKKSNNRYFYIKVDDLNRLAKNMREAYDYYLTFLERTEKYSSFVYAIRRTQPQGYDALAAAFQPIVDAIPAIVAAFRDQMERGPKSLEELWDDFVQHPPRATK